MIRWTLADLDGERIECVRELGRAIRSMEAIFLGLVPILEKRGDPDAADDNCKLIAKLLADALNELERIESVRRSLESW
jgi:hypothetical protein